MGRTQKRQKWLVLLYAMCFAVLATVFGAWVLPFANASYAQSGDTELYISDYTANAGDTIELELRLTGGSLEEFDVGINLPTGSTEYLGYTKVFTAVDADEVFGVVKDGDTLYIAWRSAGFGEAAQNQTLLKISVKIKSVLPTGTRIPLITTNYINSVKGSGNAGFRFGSIYVGVSPSYVDSIDGALENAFKNSFESEYLNANISAEYRQTYKNSYLSSLISEEDFADQETGYDAIIRANASLHAVNRAIDPYGAFVGSWEVDNRDGLYEFDEGIYWKDGDIYADSAFLGLLFLGNGLDGQNAKLYSTVRSLTDLVELYSGAAGVEKDFGAIVKSLIRLYYNAVTYGVSGGEDSTEANEPLEDAESFLDDILERYGLSENSSFTDIVNSPLFLREVSTSGATSTYVLTINHAEVIELVKEYLVREGEDPSIADIFNASRLSFTVNVSGGKISSLFLSGVTGVYYDDVESISLGLSLAAVFDYATVPEIEFPDETGAAEFTARSEVLDGINTIIENSGIAGADMTKLKELTKLDLKLLAMSLNGAEYPLLSAELSQGEFERVFLPIFGEDNDEYLDFQSAIGKIVLMIAVHGPNSFSYSLIRTENEKITASLSPYDSAITGGDYAKISQYQRLTDGTYAFYEYFGDNADFVIAASVDGKPVTKIQNNAFSKNSNILRSVVIPSTVRTIGRYAFDGCSSVESVVFEGVSTLETIENRGLYFGSDSLLLSLPTSVKYIGWYAFDAAILALGWTNANDIPKSLNNSLMNNGINYPIVLIPNGTYAIYEEIFGEGNRVVLVEESNLIDGKYVLASDGTTLLRYIGKGSHVVIPAYITAIGRDAFPRTNNDNYSFRTVEFLMATPPAFSEEDTLYYYFAGGVILIVPNGSKAAYASVFSGYGQQIFERGELTGDFVINSNNVLLAYIGTDTNVVISDGITAIGFRAFYNSSVTTVTIPSSVLRIESNAFYGASRLTTIGFSGAVNLVYIGSYAFSGTLLCDFEIPSAVTTIISNAFFGVRGVTVAAGNTGYKILDGILYDNPVTNIVSLTGDIGADIVIAEGITKADYNFYSLFNGTNGTVRSIALPSTLIEIWSNSFAYFYNLTSITF
ncbi:MAG: leucine-rich repeat domain-containing protein, partial [Clostridiales bacterium]|nr:leucine-rich repeat domain-containing protein [Clostridiales bacterium]